MGGVSCDSYKVWLGGSYGHYIFDEEYSFFLLSETRWEVARVAILYQQDNLKSHESSESLSSTTNPKLCHSPKGFKVPRWRSLRKDVRLLSNVCLLCSTYKLYTDCYRKIINMYYNWGKPKRAPHWCVQMRFCRYIICAVRPRCLNIRISTLFYIRVIVQPVGLSYYNWCPRTVRGAVNGPPGLSMGLWMVLGGQSIALYMVPLRYGFVPPPPSFVNAETSP